MQEPESEWDSVLELEWPWSYTEATKTLPYVRSLLRSLRECYIACWHYFRLNGRDPDGPAYRRPLAFHRDEGVAILEELQRMNILAYQNPLRGIALYPFLVGEGGKQREAYFVYRTAATPSTRTFFATISVSTMTCTGGSRPSRQLGKTGCPRRHWRSNRDEKVAEN